MQQANPINETKSKQEKKNDFILRKMRQAVPINEFVQADTKQQRPQADGLCMDVIGESCHEWSSRSDDAEAQAKNASKPDQMDSYDDWGSSLNYEQKSIDNLADQ